MEKALLAAHTLIISVVDSYGPFSIFEWLPSFVEVKGLFLIYFIVDALNSLICSYSAAWITLWLLLYRLDYWNF